ncbi:MAG: nicotinate-nucleotide--dimethylbenzimidazole phosphoribosyltransferase, partial [Oceanidesulfovibrio sp.]
MDSPESSYRLAVDAIRQPESDLYEAARRHLDNLTKPPGSLGRLEDLAAQLYAIRGGDTPLDVDPARIYTIAGDHGVAAPDGPGVSHFPQDVTRQMVLNFLAGGAAVNAIAHSVGAQHRVV